MPVRRLPVRPDLEQLQRQAKELLRAIHAGDASAVAELRARRPDPVDPAAAKLADAQLTLARSYDASSWTRLVHAVRLADAIWRDDAEAVHTLVAGNPALIREHILIRKDSNWGPPMTYAANLGRNTIIRMLRDMGATDLDSAAGRAALQAHTDTVRMIYEMAGRPSLEKWSLAGPTYTLNVDGTAILLMLGARATLISSHVRSTLSTSIRWRPPARASRTPRKERPSTESHFSTSPHTSTSWESPSGCSSVA